jgi:hypothetical protein
MPETCSRRRIEKADDRWLLRARRARRHGRAAENNEEFPPPHVRL